MALTDSTEHTLTIKNSGVIEWRKDRVILDDTLPVGTQEISRLPWRTTLEPGQSTTGLPAKVVALCNFVWTPAVIAAYAAWKASQPSPQG